MHRIAAWLIPLAVLAVPAQAAVSPADRSAIEAVIASQIAAFQRDDGPGAYAFAAPSVQALFPSVEIFMRMVERGYAPV